MIQVQDIMDRLTFGELASVHIAGFEDGGVQPEHYKAMITHLQAALTSLYKKFNLKMAEVIVILNPNQSIYHISSEYDYVMGRLNSGFLDDILVVTEIYDQSGKLIWLNGGEENSISMIGQTTIQVPAGLHTTHLNVVYKAAHPKLDVNAAPKDLKVELTEAFIEPLIYYIAQRVFPTNSIEGMSQGTKYLQMYEMACQELIDNGLVISNSAATTQFEKTGFM